MKVGDKVKIVKTIYESDMLQVGQTGTIKSSQGGLWELHMDSWDFDPEFGSPDDTWSFLESELEVIE